MELLHCASDVWTAFETELRCVDEEYLKRAFAIVWRGRGEADKAVVDDGPSHECIYAMDNPFVDR